MRSRPETQSAVPPASLTGIDRAGGLTSIISSGHSSECRCDRLPHIAPFVPEGRPAAACAASSIAQSKETPMPGSSGATAW